ncbi:hypothetical protein M153_1630002316 [Pseudoloma neurophilia]|uniref:Uncharacterized protein n=1 Tax=Pseudoloma neurophilia TaxID=146866 RepID=A0A0R0M5L5_9MICR|nr:hypothetical protein M153_1630002316 [Pseudoloma neurophilia]
MKLDSDQPTHKMSDQTDWKMVYDDHLKVFYLESSDENLKNLFEVVLSSNDKFIIEEFVKLCSMSADRPKFEKYLLPIVKNHPYIAIKYYDELVGYSDSKKIIWKYFTDIESVIHNEKSKNDITWMKEL